MRRVFGFVLLGLGVFFVALAILLPTVAVPGSKKTPLNLNITIVSTGTAQVLNATTGEASTDQIRATRVVRTDTKASDSKHTTVNESLCIVVVKGDTPNCLTSADPRLLSVTTDRVTTDRKSAEAVNIAAYNEAVNGKPAKHAGLGYWWPIDSKKQTYQFYEPDLLAAFPATYQGTSKIDGLTVYKYVCNTGTQPYTIGGIAPGTYTDTRTVFVEPKTGVIIDGVEHQVQALSSGQVALDATLQFDQKSVNNQANYAKNKINGLNLLQLWLPIILVVLALASFAGAFFLLRMRRRAVPVTPYGDAVLDNEQEPPPFFGGRQTPTNPSQ